MADDAPSRRDLIDWLRENWFFRQYPGFSGLLTGLGLFALTMIVLPPLWWLLSWLLRPLMTLIGQAFAWWFHLWSSRP